MKIVEKIISTNNDDFIYEGEGTFKNNVLEFNESDTKVRFVLDKDNIILERIDLEKELNFNFSKSNSYGFYLFKEYNMKKELSIVTNELITNKSSIIIDYDLVMDGISMGNFKISIKYSNK